MNVENHDHEHNNDSGRAIGPASMGGALTSLQALQTALSGVDTSSIAGRLGLPARR
jgi:hypothetical protein